MRKSVKRAKSRIAVSTWAEADGRWDWYDALLKTYLPPNPPGCPKGLSRFSNEDGMEDIMRDGQFANIQIIREEAEFAYTDEETWWTCLWSAGSRYLLETIPPGSLHSFKTEAFEQLRKMKEPVGYLENFRTLFTLAVRC